MSIKINELLKNISRNPISGIGKPEALKYKYKGFWSRRIDAEHRLIYKVKDNEILIAKCRFHSDGFVHSRLFTYTLLDWRTCKSMR